MAVDEKREAFEASCKKNEIYTARHHKYPEQYQLYETQLRWMGWQARSEHDAGEVAKDGDKSPEWFVDWVHAVRGDMDYLKSDKMANMVFRKLRISGTDREVLANWMIQQGYATGHGDTTLDLLHELKEQMAAELAEAKRRVVELEKVLTILSRRQIATWYHGVDGGYYAGWDDAEYMIRQALSNNKEVK